MPRLPCRDYIHHSSAMHGENAHSIWPVVYAKVALPWLYIPQFWPYLNMWVLTWSIWGSIFCASYYGVKGRQYNHARAHHTIDEVQNHVFSAFMVGQKHIHTVHIRYFWQGNHQINGHTRCIYTVLASPICITLRCARWAVHHARAHYRKWWGIRLDFSASHQGARWVVQSCTCTL